MHSMTGYGKGVCSGGGGKVTIEIKSVNHKFLDLNVKLPKGFLFVEDELKKAISSRISRGHVDVYLNYEQGLTREGGFDVDIPLAKSYLIAAGKLSDALGIPSDLTLTGLLKAPDVVIRTLPEADEDALRSTVLDALEEALDELCHMRRVEGESQRADLKEKLATVSESLERICRVAPSVTSDYRDKLNARVNELLAPATLDSGRLAAEVALFADKCAIDEEITRLGAHIATMTGYLDATEPVGRKLDFLTQEMNREANTIGSKANSLAITEEVLRIKNEIEKIREQTQNVE